MTRLAPIYPGDVLREDFKKPIGHTQHRVALDLAVAPSRISQRVRGKRAVTADTALRLARYLGTSPQIWLRLQTRYAVELTQGRLARCSARK